MLKAYQKIKELRIARGWSQEVLAQKIGYADKSMISRIENGKVDLTVPQLVEFAKIFGVPAPVLLGDVGDEEEDTYYIDDYVRELAQFLKDQPEYRTVFDAARTMPPEDLLAIIRIIKKDKDVQ